MHPTMGGFTPMTSYPGDDCCYLFDYHNFDQSGTYSFRDRGGRVKVCADPAYDKTHINFDTLGFDNRMSSYICGKNVWYDFCNDRNGENCGGRSRKTSGAGHIYNMAVRHLDNAASSIILGHYDPREIGAVTIFEGHECSGASTRFYWDPYDGDAGTHYSWEDIEFAGLRDNTFSSIAVPKGYVAELFTEPGFYGHPQVVEGAWKNSREEMYCVSADRND